jgi:hypothetical protein
MFLARLCYLGDRLLEVGREVGAEHDERAVARPVPQGDNDGHLRRMGWG